MKPFASTTVENTLARRWGAHTIAGLDEVGRGALAGPLVVGCVVRKRSCDLPELRDSKQLTVRKRHALLPRILSTVDTWSVGIVEADEISARGMSWALRKGFTRALAHLSPQPELVLYDGRPLLMERPRSHAIVRGDETHATIAAASILAKVIRDFFMDDMHDTFPEYAFATNKGYGTRAHLTALRSHGLVPHVHRQTFIHLKPALV